MFKFVSNKNDKLIFEIKDKNIKIPVINAIRRIIHTDMPYLAIDKYSVKFKENTSMLNDSFLIQRLTLLPIIKEFGNLEQIKISLDIKNETDVMNDVLVSQFVIENIDTQEKYNPKDIFASENILFAKVKPTQVISFSAKLVKATVRSHGASMSPVSSVSYFFKRNDNEIKDVVKTKNFETESEEKNFMNCDADKYYLKLDSGQPQVYIFNIETNGLYDNRTIFKKAINILINKLDILSDNLQTESDDVISVNKGNTLIDTFEFTILNENSTIGNLLNTYLVDTKEVDFSGYIIPHPLNNVLIIKTSLKSNNTEKENTNVFLQNIKKIKDLLNTMLKNFDKV